MAKVASRRTVEWLLTMATEHSVVFLVALELAFGTDFGVSDSRARGKQQCQGCQQVHINRRQHIVHRHTPAAR